ncbi:hypothetical protein Zmor_006121 [Zophobas morio]|uniref:Tyr recombinase domain-containing protein n=1 Tax=Zophobas morio TaxID=2755281 RepID=A0AA38MMN9_9CUCU|nr:hypothetical protein Zmor_006121 [Zophobas morio]
MEEGGPTSCTPPEIRENARIAVQNLLPEKSKPVYEKQYQVFNKWCTENKIEIISENVMLAYFERMTKNKKSSTVWSSYSMLRTCLNIYRNLDISKFARLQALLKRHSDGYQPKKSKVLEAEDIHRFLSEADVQHYLAMKVILIIAYAGALRRDEITQMSVDDIQVKEDTIFINVPKTKNKVSRLFAGLGFN